MSDAPDHQPARDILQKLLVPRVSSAIVSQGHSAVEGPVVRATDATPLGTPAALLAAYGFDGDDSPWGSARPAHVDVLRFPVEPLMQLDVPQDVGERPWPTYPTGFLHGRVPVPVWLLQRTRVPVGTEFWRIKDTGEQRALSVFAGPAIGWRGAQGYFPPLHLVGPRATWRGADHPAAFQPDGTGLELVTLTRDQVPEPFEQVRPGVWRAVLPVADCERVFEAVLTAEADGVPVRLLQRTSEESLVLLLDPDPQRVRRLEAREIEPGIFEAVVATDTLTKPSGVERELPVRSR